MEREKNVEALVNECGLAGVLEILSSWCYTEAGRINEDCNDLEKAELLDSVGGHLDIAIEVCRKI